MFSNKIKSAILFFALLIFLLLGSTSISYADNNSSATIHSRITFNSNFIFDRYDLEMYLDDQIVASLPHGTDYSGDLVSSVGNHSLTFIAKKPNIKWTGTFTASEEVTVCATVSTHSKEIIVTDFTCADDAARKAEEARKKELQRAADEAREQKLKYMNDVARLKTVHSSDAAEVIKFADEYKGQAIELEGNIAALLSFEGITEYLFRLGDYKLYNDRGANFIVEPPSSESEDVLDLLQEGKNITLSGTLKGFDETRQGIIIEPDNVVFRKESNVSPSDINNPKSVKAVQEALNSAGYDCGTPDGIAGKRTYAAISAYKSDNGIIGDAVIDAALLNTLRVSEPKEEPKPAETKSASTVSQ